ncbi:S46 family peptidase [Luteimonas abyssi]|uniref:S46 family peptidase n=1 Tax=Luteimonas abyssi TaxID=1247514 RepID=UPI000737B0EF|nr:S46 family peptidase [Luteimonas abyssi]
MKRILALAVASLVSGAATAAEGMWTLDNLPADAMRQAYGFAPDAEWTRHAMRASVRLAGGCSGSFVSADGLVLTNAHCIVGCVQGLSSPERDLLNDGFVAGSRGEELQCPAEELNVLQDITDVSGRIAQATDGLSGRAFIDARNAEVSRIEDECVADDAQGRRCDVVALYAGGLHHLYRYKRYDDVRLVFSPEYAIGFFGGDPDNFNFPRYNLDMGLLRAYENGAPAQEVEHFTLNPAGAQPGELTMVTGHPGRTQRQLTVAQLERVRDVDLINSLLLLAERRAMLAQYARGSEEAARQAQSDLTFTDNSYKVFRGQLQALLDPQVVAGKREQEAALRTAAGDAQPWDEIERAQRVRRELYYPHLLIGQQRAFDSRYFQFASTLLRGGEERPKPNAERLPEFQDAALARLEQTLLSTSPVYPAFETVKLTHSLTKFRELLGTDHPAVQQVFAGRSPEALAAELVGGTGLGDPAERERLWRGGKAAVDASQDPFLVLARAVDAESRTLRARFEAEVEAVEARNAERIARTRFDTYGTEVYPDATFTLRLSYGEVRGWNELGTDVPPYTEIGGIYRRATGFDPYALAPSWLEAQDRIDRTARFNFVSSNDIIGGNSGSPVINRDAEVVGLAFDGNIHSLGGAFWYDETLNRTVSVHSAAMLEALRTVYDAGHLVEELQPVGD